MKNLSIRTTPQPPKRHFREFHAGATRQQRRSSTNFLDLRAAARRHADVAGFKVRDAAGGHAKPASLENLDFAAERLATRHFAAYADAHGFYA